VFSWGGGEGRRDGGKGGAGDENRAEGSDINLAAEFSVGFRQVKCV